MYEKFYGLSERPFRILPDPDYLYLSAKHRLALVYLEYGLMNQAGFIVITGEIGTGKTTLIRTLLGKLDPEMRVASIFNTNTIPEELLEMILREFEIPSSGQGKTEYLNRLHHYLIEEYRQGHRVMLIVDEAQNLSLEALEEIRLISNLQTEKEHLIQIVLVGQPSLRAKLSHPRLAQFAQRISVHYHLLALDQPETNLYVEHRLRVAGFNGSALFSPGALDLIFEVTHGIPRLINILCDAALVYGYADELKTIEREVIEQVLADKKEGAILFSPSAEGSLDDARGAEDGIEERLRRLEEQVEEFQTMLKQQSSGAVDADKASFPEIEALLTEERRKNEKLLKTHQRQVKTIERLRREKKGLEERLAGLETNDVRK